MAVELPVSDSQLGWGGGGSYREVEGVAKNTSGHTLAVVTVSAVFYDEAGAQIDVGEASTQGLEPNASWHFHVLCQQRGAMNFKIKSVVGY